MKMKPRYILGVAIIFLGLAFLALAKVNQEMDASNSSDSGPDSRDAITPYIPEVQKYSPANNPTEVKSAPSDLPGVNGGNEPAKTPDYKIQTVPFLSQAPFGDWKDLRQQDGCEEASAIMAMLWVRGDGRVTKDYALSKILDIHDYEEKNYGNGYDTSAEDTLENIINGYYNYKNASLITDATLENIRNELARGNLIIAPVNGQALKNPNYSGSGPERHMLVIIGYDPVKKEFITNDPGTRKGENYRYGETLFYNSIRDYASGLKSPIPDTHKNIIVVKKS